VAVDLQARALALAVAVLSVFWWLCAALFIVSSCGTNGSVAKY